MTYRLRADLSYCCTDSHVVFLDAQNNRFFRLPEASERAFVSHVKNQEVSESAYAGLVRQNVLVEADASEEDTSAPRIEKPARSAVEMARPPCRPGMRTLLEVWTIVWSTRRRLKKRRFHDILSDVAAERSRMIRASRRDAAHAPESGLLQAAGIFTRLRLQIPIETTCLLDSIAMVRFLSRRGFSTQLVFGVIAEPFAAHCWVQFGDVALNETVGDVAAHVPIRVV